MVPPKVYAGFVQMVGFTIGVGKDLQRAKWKNSAPGNLHHSWLFFSSPVCILSYHTYTLS